LLFNPQIDMWSIGCIFAELLVGENIFKGDCESRQMEKIYDLCGPIDNKTWPECVDLAYY